MKTIGHQMAFFTRSYCGGMILFLSVILPKLDAQSGLSAWQFGTTAGSASQSGFSNGIGLSALFQGPAGIAFDSNGNLLVVDQGNNSIRKISPSTAVTTVAGGSGSSGSLDGGVNVASFSGPGAIAVDRSNNIYVSDSSNHTIRKITPAGTVSTLAGTAGISGSADGSGAAARFNNPRGLAVDSNGNLYVADSGNNVIRKVTATGLVTTIAGTAGAAGSLDGVGAAARFNGPRGLTIDGSGNIYVADTGNSTIRKISPSLAVTTAAGQAGKTGVINGTASAAEFSAPYGITIDGSGNLYVSEDGGFSSAASASDLRMISAAGTVSTLGGSSTQSGSSNGAGSNALFNGPRGIALDAAGNLYVADTGNNCIRFGYNSSAALLCPASISDQDLIYSISTGAGSLASTGGFTAVHGDAGTFGFVDVSGSVGAGQYGTYTYTPCDPTTAQISYTEQGNYFGTIVTTLYFATATSGTFVATEGTSTNSGKFSLSAPAHNYVLLVSGATGNLVGSGVSHLYLTPAGSFVFLDANAAYGTGLGQYGTYSYVQTSDTAASAQCVWGGSSRSFSLNLSDSSGDTGSYQIASSDGSTATGTFIVPAAFAPLSLNNSTEVFTITSGLGYGYLATYGGATTAYGSTGSWENLSQSGAVAVGNAGTYAYTQAGVRLSGVSVVAIK